MPDKFYLTTPLYYVNSKPHVGHSYTEIAADTLARFKRIEGDDVLFLTGTDEHGQKVEKAAHEAGMEPKQFTDKMVGTFQELWKLLKIDSDQFIRTTDAYHRETVKAVWLKLQEKEEIYTDVYAGWYCTPCEAFWRENQTISQEGQRLCPDCKRPVESLEEKNYFLKMGKHQEWLTQHIKKSPGFILPETRRNEVLGFLENNTLQDLCISRPRARLSWGIPCPLSEDHVTYVWFDALINYISACGWGRDDALFKKWWPADVHIVGKDILRHHAVYWPIILRALGVAPPRAIFAHGWWVQGGEKMSKSKGNVMDPVQIVNQYGVDAYRYFLLREVPFGSDGVFSEEALILRFNNDLANDLGNLLHRTLTMCEKYFGGIVPSFPLLPENSAIVEEARNLKGAAVALFYKMDRSMERLQFSEALTEIWSVINVANKLIERTTPWVLYKEKREEELKYMILTLVEVLKVMAQFVRPFMPNTAQSIWIQLGIGESIDVLQRQPMSWSYSMFGKRVAKGAPLFPRIENTPKI